MGRRETGFDSAPRALGVSSEICIRPKYKAIAWEKGKKKGERVGERMETGDGGRAGGVGIRKGKEERRGEDEGERASERKKSHFIHKVWL